MAYCTEQNVQDAAGGAERLRQLSDWDSTNAIDSTKIAEKIDEAERLIDSYARVNHTVPFVDGDVPAQIVRICARIAVFLLAEARNQEEPYLDRHERDIRWLEDLSRGRVRIALPSTDPSKKRGSSGGETAASTGDYDSPNYEGLW